MSSEFSLFSGVIVGVEQAVYEKGDFGIAVQATYHRRRYAEGGTNEQLRTFSGNIYSAGVRVSLETQGGPSFSLLVTAGYNTMQDGGMELMIMPGLELLTF